MRKNLLNSKVADEVIARIKSLQVTDKGKWGRMEVTEMLHHCQRANAIIITGKSGYKRSTVKQKVLRFMYLYFISTFPKNIKGPKRIDPKNATITPEQFDEEKGKLIETIREFSKLTKPIEINHPLFGRLNNKEWGIFTWMHMDHHLRQFGV